MSITWVLEKIVFDDQHQRLAEAAQAAGQKVRWWKDDWLMGKLPKVDGFALFHGSLGVAAQVAEDPRWRPGAFCKTSAFHCSAWYERAQEWLVHEKWTASTVRRLVDDPHSVLGPLGVPVRFFVRPDSPLKPFAGRVLSVDELSLKALDHGFYYDDENLPIIVAPIREILDEWRFVVVGKEVVAWSSYEADRSEKEVPVPDEAKGLAEHIAQSLDGPEAIYVMDLCRLPSGLALMELNPFSGADLYGCDRSAVVQAVAQLLETEGRD